MELVSINQFTYVFVSLFCKEGQERIGVLVNTFVALGIWIALFVLQGVAIFIMMKRAGLKKKAWAFIPFLNFYCIGKLAGECGFFGYKMKGAWIYALVFQVISSIYAALYLSAEFYLYFKFGAPTSSNLDPSNPALSLLARPEWSNVSGFSKTVADFYTGASGIFYGVSGIMSIVNLVTQILLTILLAGLYKKYSPRNYRTFTVITFLFPWIRYIFIFALRENASIDYEEYMRRQREAYARRQQYYYGNNPYGGYGSPYNNPYGGQSQNGYQPPQPPPPADEPFDEFASPSGGNQKGESNSDDPDEFFN